MGMNGRFFKVLAMIGIIATMASAQTSAVWDGSIDVSWYENNSWETSFTITTAEQLAGLAKLVNEGNNFGNRTIKLGANIMLNDTTNWQNWYGNNAPVNHWTAIGGGAIFAPSFNGTFDGNGYVVNGVYLNNNLENQGLFGIIGFNGTIKNLGIVTLYIKGDGGVGGLAGTNQGTIKNSYLTGNVRVIGNSSVGGLVAGNEGSISNSYSTGNVQGNSVVGGLAGSNWGAGAIISNSYSIGNVEGVNNVGGLVGIRASGIVNNSFYDRETSGQSDIGRGIPKTTAEMKEQETFVDWDFDEIWNIDGTINNGYPFLRMLTDITERVTDDNFRAAIYNKIGKSASAPIFISDVANIDTLKLSGSRTRSETQLIRDLSGIEYFVNLRFLDISDNAITELDLSNNRNLEHLDVSGNQLKRIDITNNIELRFLDVSGNSIPSKNDVIGLENTKIDIDNFDIGEQNVSIRNPATKRNATSFAFAGIKNGQINLRLQAGNYTAELYNLQGRLVGRADINATTGINATGLRTDNLGRGVFILNVKRAGNSVLRQKISVR